MYKEVLTLEVLSVMLSSVLHSEMANHPVQHFKMKLL